MPDSDRQAAMLLLQELDRIEKLAGELAEKHPALRAAADNLLADLGVARNNLYHDVGRFGVRPPPSERGSKFAWGTGDLKLSVRRRA